MLSLTPRFDLFRFAFPKEFIPPRIREKYDTILAKTPGVLTTAIDYLNESIQGVTIPGISEITVTQSQTSHNTIVPSFGPTDRGLGKLNIGRMDHEASHDATYYTAANPLSNIERTFKVTLRQNQSLYNYWMLYETVFERLCKPTDYKEGTDVFRIDLLNDDGVNVSCIEMYQMFITGLSGLEFNYSKLERSTETFEIEFAFNNINFYIVTDNVVKDGQSQM